MRAAYAIAVVLFLGNSVVAQDAKKLRLDAAGDPLPAQALHRFGTARFCTRTEVTSLVLSQDGKLLAGADRDGRTYLWDADTGKERRRTSPGNGKRIAISPDSQWLATGEDWAFELYNLTTDKRTPLAVAHTPRLFAFSHNSKLIVTVGADDDDVVLHDIAAGKALRTFAAPDDKLKIETIAFSPDGKYFAAAGVPMVDMEKPFVRVIIWNALEGTKLKQIDHTGKQIRNLVFLLDNKTLIGQIGARLVGWDVATGERVNKIGHDVGSAFALDSACKLLATTAGPKVIEFDTGKEVHEFEAPTLLRHLALSGNGKLLAASAARFDSASPRLMLWDLTTGKERTVAAAHRHYVDAVAFSHDGKLIATASNVEGAARVWDAKSSRLIHALDLDSLAAKKSGGPRARLTLLGSLAFSVDRHELFVSGQRWDLSKGEPIQLKADDDFLFEQINSTRAVTSPDGKLTASILHDGSIQFWDPARALALKRVKPAEGHWAAFAFSPNGKFAANGKWFAPIGPESGEPIVDTVNIIDVEGGKRVKNFRARPTPVVRLMFAPDGETLAVIGFPARLELWHLPTGRLLREMYLTEIDDTPRPFAMPTVAFAPHGQWIAFAHQPEAILLIETMTGKEIKTLHGHQGHVSSLAFAPDSRRLLSGGRDTTALMWSALPANAPLPAFWKDDEKLWQALGGTSAEAYQVIWPLIARPDRAIEVLSKRLQPDEGATEKEIRELITNLSAPKFPKRDAAMHRLKQIGVRSLPALEQALKKAPDLETGRRIQDLLKTVETSLTPESLRDYRGLLILEMIASKESRQLLANIARGDAAAGKTRMAQAALWRMK